MKLATAKQIKTANLSDIRIKTKKSGLPRCESNEIYEREIKIVDGRQWITLSSAEGDATIVVDDENEFIVDSEDPAGDYTHTIFLTNPIDNHLEKTQYIHMCSGCRRNTSGCDHVTVYDGQDEIATVHVECLCELNFRQNYRLEHQPVPEQKFLDEHTVVTDYEGNIGTIVHVYRYPAYEIEFQNGELKTVDVNEVEENL